MKLIKFKNINESKKFSYSDFKFKDKNESYFEEGGLVEGDNNDLEILNLYGSGINVYFDAFVSVKRGDFQGDYLQPPDGDDYEIEIEIDKIEIEIDGDVKEISLKSQKDYKKIEELMIDVIYYSVSI